MGSSAAPLVLSVITVNWNVRDLLLESMASVAESAAPLTWEHIVVDNASTDGSVEAIRERFPKAVVIANPHNPGFGAANNQGARIARGRYLLFLNPDTRVIGDALPALVRTLETCPEIGALGSRLLDADLRWSRDMGHAAPSLRTVVNDYLQLSRVFAMPHLFPGIVRSTDVTRLETCEWASGAALMVRREVFAAEPWNEQIFFFAEDIEYCDRIRRRGWTVAITPDASIVHLSGQSMARAPEDFLSDKMSGLAQFVKARQGPVAAWLAMRTIAASLLLRSHAHRVRYWMNGDPSSLQKSRRLRQYRQLQRG
ncbi:MAG TPA: glycosyltransferase family 2 protein [Vicinamibacterales bacterium]|nr:glycosyltransferase family 2 protein [Vicinamibacterales bacterium]